MHSFPVFVQKMILLWLFYFYSFVLRLLYYYNSDTNVLRNFYTSILGHTILQDTYIFDIYVNKNKKRNTVVKLKFALFYICTVFTIISFRWKTKNHGVKNQEYFWNALHKYSHTWNNTAIKDKERTCFVHNIVYVLAVCHN